MTYYWYWLALGWAVCGFLAYGRWLAHSQKAWPSRANIDRNRDRKGALVVALWGPFGFIVALAMSHHGFMWRLPPRKDG